MAQRKSFLIRIDPVLLDELRRWASAELRSVNGQIEYILRDALARRRAGAARDATDRRNPENQSPSS